MSSDRASLAVQAGPALPRVELDPAESTLLGRASDATVRLNDAGVSRRHARIEFDGDRWLLTDLESRHGTTVDGERLVAGQPRPLEDGNQIAIGPWMLRFSGTASQRSTVISVDDRRGGTASFTRIDRAALGSIAERRLEAIIRVAAALHTAVDEQEAAMVVADALVGGTGFQRVAVVRPLAGVEELEVLVALDRGQANPQPRFSRSLLAAALEGQLVQMRDMPALQEEHSIISMGLAEAMCAPVRVDGDIGALVYLDSESVGARPQPDAAIFVSAVADLCGFALSHVAALQAKALQEELIQDLQLARQVQERLMPRTVGTLNGLQYAVGALPGRHVAGDLFGLIDLGEGRTALLLGDVAGKGAAAGMLMATVQAQIEALLEHGASLVEAVERSSSSLMRRAAAHEFVTLWIGILDTANRTMEYIDGGHGYAYLLVPGAEPLRLDAAGGLPLGAVPNATYPSAAVDLPERARLVVVSDGVIEQSGPTESQFGTEGLLRTVKVPSKPQQEVENVVTALRVHAGGMDFSDDVTVVSVHF